MKAHRFEGAHSVYTLAALGGQIEVVELGTSARHRVDSTIDITLPPQSCWAYSADETVAPE